MELVPGIWDSFHAPNIENKNWLVCGFNFSLTDFNQALTDWFIGCNLSLFQNLNHLKLNK